MCNGVMPEQKPMDDLWRVITVKPAIVNAQC